MTIIVYRDGVMAADSGAWSGDFRVGFDGEKVYKIHGHLVGCLGAKALTRSIIEDYRRHGSIEAIAKKTTEHVTMMVVTPRRRLMLLQHGSIMHLKGPFYADGSDARAVAWGALYAGASARRACEIAIKVGPWAAEPIKTVRL